MCYNQENQWLLQKFGKKDDRVIRTGMNHQSKVHWEPYGQRKICLGRGKRSVYRVSACKCLIRFQYRTKWRKRFPPEWMFGQELSLSNDSNVFKSGGQKQWVIANINYGVEPSKLSGMHWINISMEYIGRGLNWFFFRVKCNDLTSLSYSKKESPKDYHICSLKYFY